MGEGKTRGREGKRKERGESEAEENFEQQEKRGRGKGLGVVKNERRKGECEKEFASQKCQLLQKCILTMMDLQWSSPVGLVELSCDVMYWTPLPLHIQSERTSVSMAVGRPSCPII